MTISGLTILKQHFLRLKYYCLYQILVTLINARKLTRLRLLRVNEGMHFFKKGNR